MPRSKKKKRTIPIRKKEQIKLLYSKDYMTIGGIRRLGLKDFYLADGSNGLRLPIEKSGPMVDLERSNPATCFPALSALGCSFDEEVLSSVGKAIGQEAKLNQIGLVLAPSLNIKRNPLCGRNFEYISEDPLINGKLGGSFVKGVQEVNVGCCIKHFAANNQETYRMVNDSIMDERTLNEIYLKPFEIAIKEAKPWAMMTSYNKINGIYSVQNDLLINGLVREKWGFTGVVLSDWCGSYNYVIDHNRGLDFELSGNYNRYNELYVAYNRAKLYKEEVKLSAHRIFDMLQKSNANENYKKDFTFEQHHQVAKESLQKSIVLLENDGVLPLKNFKDVCVIGALAKNPRIQGSGSNLVHPTKVISFIDAIDNSGLLKTNIPYSAGYDLDQTVASNDLILDAVDLASRSKTVIVFLGLLDFEEGEGFDRKHLQLSESQIRLFNSIYSINPNIILVLNTGSPVELPFAKKCRGIVLTHLGGQAIGDALLSIIRGEVNPSGKLVESWPLHLSDVPSFGFYPGDQNQSIYREAIYVGYRYYLSCNKNVLYPFGYGLSYSRFKFSEFELSAKNLDLEGSVTASVIVTNLSKVDGATVVQLYSERDKSNIFRPRRVLIAYKKVYVEAGKSKKVSITLDVNSFSHYDVESHSFGVEKGVFRISLCLDSTNVIDSKTINVDGLEYLSKRSYLPNYYEPDRNGFLQYENDFENLLGKTLMASRDPKTKPYTMNSTVSDIERTWIGKKILLEVNKRKRYLNRSGMSRMQIHASKETPFRAMTPYFKRERYAYIVCDLANGRLFKAIGHFIFGHSNNYD